MATLGFWSVTLQEPRRQDAISTLTTITVVPMCLYTLLTGVQAVRKAVLAAALIAVRKPSSEAALAADWTAVSLDPAVFNNIQRVSDHPFWE